MALAVDPRIEAILTAARGRVVQGNARRQQMALMAALGLTDAGLFERSNAVVQGQANAGFAEAPDLQNTTYGVQQGPQGRAFRQGYMNIDSGAAARGAGFGSGVESQRFQLTRQLNDQINAALRGFDASQADTLSDQSGDLGQWAGQIADIRFEQGRDEAATRTGIPAQPAPTAAGGFTAPPGTPGFTAAVPNRALPKPPVTRLQAPIPTRRRPTGPKIGEFRYTPPRITR